MYALPPADTVAGDILRRMPRAHFDSNAAIMSNYSVPADDTEWVTIVSTVILSLTVIGAMAILGTMAYLEYKGRPGTTRQRIVQSLVLSDLILGIVGLIGSAAELADHPLTPGTATCDGLGFMLITVLWTEHLWTLALAIATYLILIYPLHTLTILLERHWYILWLLVWATAISVATAGLVRFGFFPAGGLCYYGTNTGVYSELIQFIPRGLVFVTITILYWRLFVFLRRPDRIGGSFSDTGTANTTRRGRLSQVLGRGSSRRLTGLFSRIIGVARPQTASQDKALHEEKIVRVETRRTDAPGRIDLPKAGRPDGWPMGEKDVNGDPTNMASDQGQLSPGAMSPRTIGTPVLPTPTIPSAAEIPPWEKVQLPVFEVDGQRYGGSAANASVQRDREGLWGNWKGLGGQKESKRRPGTGGSASGAGGPSSSMKPFHRPSTATSDGGLGSAPRSPPLQGRERDASDTSGFLPDHTHLELEDGRPRWPSIHADGIHPPDEQDRLRKVSATSAGSYTPSLLAGHLLAVPESVPSLRGDSRRSSSPAAHDASLNSRRTSTAGTPRNQRSAAAGGHASSRMFSGEDESGTTTPRARTSHPILDVEMGGHPRLPNPEDASDNDDDGDEDDGDDRLDFLRMLAEDDPHGAHGAGGQGGSRARHDGSGSNGEEYEFVEESMSSYLNRKTALLMLWFPLGYVLLFSVSLIRIIYDFVGTPPAELRAVSRWFIFAQGILDAFIYGVVEWHTKRIVRKRVRKGTFSPNGSRSPRDRSAQNSAALGLGSALRGFRASGSRQGQAVSRPLTRGARSQGMGEFSQHSFGGGAGQGGQSGAPLESEDPKSLMQAMDMLGSGGHTADSSADSSAGSQGGLRIGGLPPGMLLSERDPDRRGSEAHSDGSQLTHVSKLSAGSSTSNGASTKVSTSSPARKGDLGPKRIDPPERQNGGQ